PGAVRSGARAGARAEDRARPAGRILRRHGRTVKAYVGLGSNLGSREEMIARALGLLTEEDGIRVMAVSTIRETDPVGIEDQPRFLNGAAVIETDLTARELLDRL